ncbi:MAG: methylated-DNA--[protein]-cysteine S-methyltransferase [Magnetococcus sp. DMHC-6]
MFFYPSPLGNLWLMSTGAGLEKIFWQPPLEECCVEEGEIDKRACDWLEDYFNKRFRPIDFPLHPIGTPFQQRVWQQLVQIPVGDIFTYGALAAQLFTSARAVGQALGKNPLPIVIPCHRVVAADGVGGFSAFGGRQTKVVLLAHEGLNIMPCGQKKIKGQTLGDESKKKGGGNWGAVLRPPRS